MANGVLIEYREEESELSVKVMSSHVPKVDEEVVIDGENFKVFSVKHEINQDGDIGNEKFIVKLTETAMRY